MILFKSSSLIFVLLLPLSELACTHNCGDPDQRSTKRLKMPNKSVFTRISNLQLQEIFSISNEISHEVCAQLCDAHAECAIFEFNLPNKLCILAEEYARLSEDLVEGAFTNILFVKVRGRFTKALPREKESCQHKSEHEAYVRDEVDKWLAPSPLKTTAMGASQAGPTSQVDEDLTSSYTQASSGSDSQDARSGGPTGDNNSTGASTSAAVAGRVSPSIRSDISMSSVSASHSSVVPTETEKATHSLGTTVTTTTSASTAAAVQTTSAITQPAAATSTTAPSSLSSSSSTTRSDPSTAGSVDTTTKEQGGEESTQGSTLPTSETEAQESTPPEEAVSSPSSEASSEEPSTVAATSPSTPTTLLPTVAPLKYTSCAKVIIDGTKYDVPRDTFTFMELHSDQRETFMSAGSKKVAVVVDASCSLTLVVVMEGHTGQSNMKWGNLLGRSPMHADVNMGTNLGFSSASCSCRN